MDPTGEAPLKDPHMPRLHRVGDLIAPRRRRTSRRPTWKREP